VSCKDILRHIEDFYFGELDEKTAQEVQSHLRSCRECGRALEDLSVEDKTYQAYTEALDRGLEVSPHIWRRIQAQIGTCRPETSWRHPLGRIGRFLDGILPRSVVLRQAVFAAVIVVLSVGTTLLTVHYYRTREAGIDDQPLVRTSDRLRYGGSQNSLEAAIGSIQRAERDYNNAIEILSKIVDKRKPSLDPQFVAELERNLKAIDESIAGTRSAYHAHPTDPELAHYMLTAYEKKVELLLEVAS
jgi:hypothetical protein